MNKKWLQTEPSLSNSSKETHWEKAAKTRMGKYLTKLEVDFIAKASALLNENSLVLDVGAEAGRMSMVALQTNATVLSIDIDSVSLRRLKQKTRQANIVLADARNLPFKDGVLDCVFLIEVLDYIPELELALADCNRVLKADGFSILSFGNSSSLKAKMRLFKGRSYLHSYGKAVQTLFKTGFVLKKRLGYNWLPFGRSSQNRFVPVLAWLEWFFGLRKVVKYSPWVMMHVVKQPK